MPSVSGDPCGVAVAVDPGVRPGNRDALGAESLAGTDDGCGLGGGATEQAEANPIEMASAARRGERSVTRAVRLVLAVSAIKTG